MTNEVNAELIHALERAEQTIRNLGNGFLTGDGQVIALNEASNIRAAIKAASAAEPTGKIYLKSSKQLAPIKFKMESEDK